MSNMQFNHKDEVVIVDETKQSVFEAKQIDSSTSETPSIDLKKGKVNIENWIDAYSDCA